MKKTLSILLIASLSACTTASKPGVAINPLGPVGVQKKNLLGTPLKSPLPSFDRNGNPYELFDAWYQTSYNMDSPCIVNLTAMPAQEKSDTPTEENNSTKIADTTAEPKSKFCKDNSDDRIVAAQGMMLSGFAYSELLCDRYFNVLANRNQDLSFGIENTSMLSGFTSAVLGLTGSPTKSVSLVATGFAATIAGMESYQQHYHFGPDVSAVRRLIMDGQKNYQSSLSQETLGNLDHYKAVSHIKAHQAICQVDYIKSLVTAAVEKQELTFATAARDQFYSDTSLVGIQASLEELSGISNVTPDQIVNLYWLFNIQTTDEVRKEYLRLELGDLKDTFLTTEGKTIGGTVRDNAAMIVRNISPPSLKAQIAQKATAKNLAALEQIKAKASSQNETEGTEQATPASLPKTVTPAEAPLRAILQNR